MAGHADAHCWIPFDICCAICTGYHEPNVVWEDYQGIDINSGEENIEVIMTDHIAVSH